MPFGKGVSIGSHFLKVCHLGIGDWMQKAPDFFSEGGHFLRRSFLSGTKLGQLACDVGLWPYHPATLSLYIFSPSVF